MLYQSTRNSDERLPFDEVVLQGLATDGGLFLPVEWPTISSGELSRWRMLGYTDLAFEVMKKFVGDSIPEDDFKRIVEQSYKRFDHPAVAPLKQLDSSLWVLELFHGPTLAFKDFALQFLGQLLDYLLNQRGEHGVVVGATSGDTGSAAIEGCRHCDKLDIFILHPNKRVSEVQRRQMTTVESSNVYNMAVNGNFDDCQQLVKESFSMPSFMPDKQKLIAVNSINWARIMAQVVYYVYAALRVGAPGQPVSFSVPTGNFGDIFAGYVAKKMGISIDRLIIATNQNDILVRALNTGELKKAELQHTLSPSMDIVVSSNFERLIYLLSDRDSNRIADIQNQFSEGKAALGNDIHNALCAEFDAYSLSDEQTVAEIKRCYEACGYVLDPHTAIGVVAARETNPNSQVVCLSTAHPVKFGAALNKAGVPEPDLPVSMADLMERTERFQVMPNDLEQVQNYIVDTLL